MNRRAVIVGSYSLIHAVVDMGCAFLVAGITAAAGADVRMCALAVVVYDVVAFALQLPFGFLADRLNRNALVSAFGCILVAVGIECTEVPMAAVVIAGIGNACFHVGGGIDVLNISDEKAALPGVYVATGAVGLYLGTRGNVWSLSAPWMCSALLLSSLLLVWLYRKVKREYRIENAPCTLKIDPDAVTVRAQIIFLCLFLTICVRGGLGLAMSFSWNKGFGIGLCSVGAVALGKALGGVLGDRFGWLRTTVASLAAAAVLFVFADGSMVCGLSALLLFNMTMPITLAASAGLFPKHKGAAFGATTFALVAGAMPVLLGNGNFAAHRFVPVAATIGSAVLLAVGLTLYRKEKMGE